MTVGGMVVKRWSSTQGPIATSSGEWEYDALVRGAAKAIGLQARTWAGSFSPGCKWAALSRRRRPVLQVRQAVRRRRIEIKKTRRNGVVWCA